MAERTVLGAIATYTSQAGSDSLWSYQSPLLTLLVIIPYLHYDIRKHLLNCTRIQVSQTNNFTLSDSYNVLIEKYPYVVVPFKVVQQLHRLGLFPSIQGKVNTLWTSRVLSLYENFYDSPTACTILSYMVRAEQTVFPAEFLEIGTQGMDKEVKSSQQQDLPQELNYRGLFTEALESIHEGINVIPTQTFQLWKTHLATIKNHLSKSSTIILPHYNKRKNVSYETQDEYYILSGLNPSTTKRDVTTFDLLRLYSQNGLQISGALELRQAWRFNDLKPRLYYCLGGSAFWDALYIRDLTKMFMAAFPSTHAFTRFDVKRIVRLSHDEILVTYDYSSFTTSLAELKYFMWYLATVKRSTLATIFTSIIKT